MKRQFALMIFILISIAESHSQGCSDAGFCTMGAMRPDQSYSSRIDLKLRTIELNYYKGKTTLSPVIQAYTVDVSIGINDKNSVQIKLPYQTVSGNFGSNEGLGDISISASRMVGTFNDYAIGLTLGGKIPSGYGSDKASGQASTFGANNADPGDLPMYYQVSLGTYDIVAGASIINEKWLFATGIQIPVIHKNDNDFRWGKWPEYPGGTNYTQKYFLANNLKRGTDVMLRAERNFRFLNYNFSLGALPIYRITKDRRYDFTPGIEKEVTVPRTTGLALSILGGAGYSFSANNSVKLIYGHRLTDRKKNPDGLTRHTVLSFSYMYKF